ncbi:MAG: hypothetical protein R2857_03730 [Vampirovibrionales bacterium]
MVRKKIEASDTQTSRFVSYVWFYGFFFFLLLLIASYGLIAES